MRNFDLPGRSPVIAENGMAATSHPLATATALDVLREGGNAVDAAIAAAAVLAVVEPHMTGIGGDCFVILAEPDGTIHGLNGSGRAPALASAERLRADGHVSMPQSGPHSVTVPGAIAAWDALAERFASRGFDRLFSDAIAYAENGFAVHPRVASDWQRFPTELAADEGGSRHYLLDGAVPETGDRVRLPALGQTLRRIASDGAKAFYEGEIAAEIASVVQDKGGVLSEDDLASVAVDWVTPIATSYGGCELLEIPPNGQGITALILLNLLTELDAKRLAPGSVDRLHLMMEAGRIAYAVRDHYVADPAAMTVSPEDLLSGRHTRALASKFDPERRNAAVELPEGPNADTVYLTVVDRDLRAVSFINSLYTGFGSKIVTPNSGIALQSRGGCFTLREGHPNEYGASKRPMHTIIPAMALRGGKAFASFGVMGGAYQPMGHAHVFSNIVDHGMDPQAAIDEARIFWGEDGVLEAETGIGTATRKGLEARGHQIRDAGVPHGGAQAIVIDRDRGFLVGGSDPRKDGLALGW